MTEKEYTVESLRADKACASGMAFVVPLIESGEFTPEKLLERNKNWLLWAVVRGYKGRELVADEFGPQMDLVISLIQRARNLTEDEIDALWEANDAARVAPRNAAWRASHAAICADRVASREATWGAASRADSYAALDAAVALIVRDLIGQHGFTQKHYDTLTGPWRRAIGKIHPDDEELQ